MTDSKTELLTPDNCPLIVIDDQPQMTFGVQSDDRQTMFHHVIGLAGDRTIRMTTPS